jgi:hypothetical protein
MADIVLTTVATPSPITKGHGELITIENNVEYPAGTRIATDITFSPGLFVPNRGTPVPTSIPASGTETFKLGATTATGGGNNPGKTYTWDDGSPAQQARSGTIRVS